jgi:predicted nucleic acid-binding protein
LIFFSLDVGRVLLDTNILIDYLKGIESAREEIRRYERPLISAITWMEVMVGTPVNEESKVRPFLERFTQIAIDKAVAEKAVAIRRESGLRLPDAIIWASAQCEEALLITRNSKDFPADYPGVRIPYQLP